MSVAKVYEYSNNGYVTDTASYTSQNFLATHVIGIAGSPSTRI